MSWKNHKKNIHNVIRKHHPHAINKAKRLFRFKYPKLFLLIILIAFAYFLFKQPAIQSMVLNLNKFNYLGFFIAGILFAFGFSAPFSVGFFLLAQPENLLVAALLGGLGAVAGDIIVFKTIKLSFMDEFNQLKKKKIVKKIENMIRRYKNILVRHYFLYIFAGIMIAAPVSDEIGISMLAGLTTIKTLALAIIGFVVQTITIFLILYSSSII